jgi:flagellar FliL protein
MAKDEGAEEAVPAGSSKKLVLIIIIVVLVLAIVGGAAAYFLMGNKKDKGHEKETEKHEEHAKTVTVPFEEKFTVNIQGGDGSAHYLQVPKLELELGNEEGAKLVEEKKSKVSDRISSLLRTKTMEELQQPGSDIKLKEDLKKAANEALELKSSEADKKGVKEVLLPASFIIQ